MKTDQGQSQSSVFIDSHHHLWDLDLNHYRWLEEDGDITITEWLGDYSSIRCNYLGEDYLREAKPAGLIKSVHIQAGWIGKDNVDETCWVQEISNRWGLPNGIIAEVNLRSQNVELELNQHIKCQNFRGVRMTPMAGLVVDMNFQRGFAKLRKLNLSYDLNTRVPYMSEGASLAMKFPDTMIIIDNTGNPMERTEEYFQKWRSEMSQLAEYPNVAVKISGLGMSDHSWTIDSIRRWVLTTIDLFGTDRCMFASNWPVDKLYSTYSQLINAYRDLTSSYTQQEINSMFSLNAERYYRI